MTRSGPSPTPRGARGTGHGGRTARRAERRRHRTWGIVAVVAASFAVCAGVAVGAAALLGGDDTASSAPLARRSVAPSTTTTTVGAPAASTAPARPCRAPLTPDDPLRLWIAGDSIAWSVGNGLGKRAAGTGIVAPVYESRVSSGLANPGFFDWPRRAAQEIPRLDPEIVVFVMGTNDWAVPQSTPVDASGQPAWRATYARNVEAMVDALTSGGRTLYWVGPPVLRDTKQDAGVRAVAEVTREVVERNPDAEFVDARDLLDSDSGSYTAVVEVDGKKVQVRAGDGVHLTPDGGDYVGDAVFAHLDVQCRLKAQAVAGKRQPLVETEGSTSVAPGATAPPTPTTGATIPSTSAPLPTTTPTITPTTGPTTPTTGAPGTTTPTTTAGGG